MTVRFWGVPGGEISPWVEAPKAPNRKRERERVERHSDSPPLHNKRDVDLVFFVIETERVHGDVDAEPDALLALQFAAGSDLEFPGAERIAGERADQIVAGIEDGDAAAQLETLEIRRGGDAAGRSGEQVERLVEDVFARDA